MRHSVKQSIHYNLIDLYILFLSHTLTTQARCALCREPLPRRTPSVNIVLRSVIEKAFPDEFEERVDEGRREVDFFRSNDAVFPTFKR